MEPEAYKKDEITSQKIPYTDSYRERMRRYFEQGAVNKEGTEEQQKQEVKIEKKGAVKKKEAEEKKEGEPEKILQEVKEKIGRDYELAKEFIKEPKNIRVIKFIIMLIPLILLFYLVYANFVSSRDFSYFYDIGSKEDVRKSYLSPINRISDVLENPAGAENTVEDGAETYRNLTSSLVYFDVPIPRGSESVKVQLKFKDNFPENYGLSIGAKDQEVWHYKYNSLYTPALINLSQFSKKENVYLINKELDLISFQELKKEKDIVIATDKKLISEQNFVEDYKANETIINSSLRGGHTFYAYLSGNLVLEVKKQDINWYNGSDELEISVYNQENLIASTTIPDDGLIETQRGKAEIQKGGLELYNLPEGVYRIEFRDFDGLIREIKINTNKIVAADKVYLADSSVFFDDIEKLSVMYTKFFRKGEISFKTWHAAAFQTVFVNNNPVEIKERVNESVFKTDAGESDYEIKSLKNDIIVSAPGYFAFSKENYFEPFKQRVFPIKNNIDWLENNVDYLVTEYTAPAEENGWLIAEAEFSIKENNLYIKDNKLSMLLNAPHLGKEEYSEKTIPIDWIKITVNKPGLI